MREKWEGFTLVEMMVTVSIVAILTAVAVPQYQRYASRARQVEAKAALASIYQVEKNFFTDKGSYTLCLRQSGFTLEGARRYYHVGFTNPSGNNCGPDGGSSCYCWEWPAGTTGTACQTAVGWCNAVASYHTVATVASNSAWAFPTPPPTSTVTKLTFTAEAIGSISGDAATDLWEIDHNKNLVNRLTGF